MNITVYCGSNFGDNPHFEEAAHDLGAWIARAGHTLVYGGSSVGLMGAVSRAAIEGGAPVIGVEPEFFIEAGVAQHDLTELIVVETMGERKSKMIELGDAFVALPGGVGTLEEISEIFTRVRLDMGPHECFLLNIDGFYDPLRLFRSRWSNAGFSTSATSTAATSRARWRSWSAFWPPQARAASSAATAPCCRKQGRSLLADDR